ncbi:hypothetical protein [Hymenobacter psoromatis]|uniref:hypothetical protein n=1 Tax=Hymenobacter psoromatis TaxID=1484116 RepID=UPI001CBD3CC2|nr:hypothetical protein [Hymenobacter psoromatis]
MASPTDTLRAKTNTELQFFVDNPGFYHADLVEAAQRELRRRDVAPAAALPPPAPYSPAEAEPAPTPATRRWPLLAGLLVLGAAGTGWLWHTRTPVTTPANRPGQLSPDSLRLESVRAHPLPSFDTDAIVAAQLVRVPTSEKQEAQALRQFRELGRRFWSAETQTEFLTNQAHAGQVSPMFAEQALLVRENWRAWNKAVVYSYRFGPTMQGQFERMAQAASSQQHILANMPGLLPGRKFLTDKEMLARDAEVQDWLAGLRKTSPVTGRPYRVTVLHFQ